MLDQLKRFEQFKAELNIPYYQACGILQCFAALLEANPELSATPHLLAEAIEWEGSPDALWDALSNAGFIRTGKPC